MYKYVELLEFFKENLEDYKRLLNEKLDKFKAPLIFQYRSEIQDIIDYFEEKKEEIPYSVYNEFNEVLKDLEELDNKMLNLFQDIKRLIGNIGNYRSKYSKHHWWWYS